MKPYLLSLFLPLGRLSMPAYWIFATPLLAALLGFRYYLQSTAEIGENWYLLLILLLWIHFSLLSRRLQDNGLPGVMLLPFFGCLFFVLGMEVDPLVFGIDPADVEAKWSSTILYATLGGGLLACALVYGLLITGDGDENAYGPPFGETSETARQKKSGRIRDRVRAEYGDSAVCDPYDGLTEPVRDEVVYEVRGGVVTEHHQPVKRR